MAPSAACAARQPPDQLGEPMVWISTLVLAIAAAKAVSLLLDEAIGPAAFFGMVHDRAIGAAVGSLAAMS